MCHHTVSLVAEQLELNSIPAEVLGTARDIGEQVGVPRFVHLDFPQGNPCGEPDNVAQQREILEMGFKLLALHKRHDRKPGVNEIGAGKWKQSGKQSGQSRTTSGGEFLSDLKLSGVLGQVSTPALQSNQTKEVP